MYIHVCVSVSVCVCVHACVYVCVCACVCECVLCARTRLDRRLVDLEPLGNLARPRVP